MELPKYEHKYLSVFDSMTEYNDNKKNFEECNISVITSPNQTETDKRDYYPSVRTTNEDNQKTIEFYTTDELISFTE